VPLAVDPAFRPPPDAPDHDNREHDPYVLVVSAFDPRKGFREAFEVIGALADAGLPHRLKVAGNLPSWVRPVVEKLRADASHPERVEILGFVDDLVPLYWNAAATIVTSRYEGFGLPALEAMASGSPLVAFANTSLPEVVRDGGVLVPDGDVAGFASALIAVLADESRRTDLVEAGLARAADFTLDAMVEGHVDVYRSVLR
jgi:glycosyltransferase involved in cell wall biosynthesis